MIVAVEGNRLEEAEKANPTCVSDYTKCKNNQELVEKHKNKDHISLPVECEAAAKRFAKYGEPNFPFIPFGQYFYGSSYIDNGKAILIEDGATFKNGFGADEHVTVRCEYDLKNDIADVTIIPKD